MRPPITNTPLTYYCRDTPGPLNRKGYFCTELHNNIMITEHLPVALHSQASKYH